MGPRMSVKAATVLLLAAAAEAFCPVRVVATFPILSTGGFSSSVMIVLALLLIP